MPNPNYLGVTFLVGETLFQPGGNQGEGSRYKVCKAPLHCYLSHKMGKYSEI